MKRHLLGIIALALILSGLVGWLMAYSSHSAKAMKEAVEGAGGVGLRAGLILGALWLAYPQLIAMAQAVPKWLIGAIAVGAVVVVAVGSKMIVFVLGAIGVLVALQFAGQFLKPLPKKTRRPDPPHTK